MCLLSAVGTILDWWATRQTHPPLSTLKSSDDDSRWLQLRRKHPEGRGETLSVPEEMPMLVALLGYRADLVRPEGFGPEPERLRTNCVGHPKNRVLGGRQSRPRAANALPRLILELARSKRACFSRKLLLSR